MSLFADEYCLVCNGVIEPVISWRSVILTFEEDSVCQTCHNKLKPLVGDTCRICCRLLESEYKRGDLCFDCIRWEEDSKWRGLLTENISLYQYNDFLKGLIAKYKYRGDYQLARVFKNAMCANLKGRTFDYLVPIPLSQERLYERGFNQAEALIIEAGFQSVDLLSRIHTEKQSKKSRDDRIHLPQVFQITQAKIPLIPGKKILLVDDIYTTGSTLRHAAKVLQEHGAKSVISLTLAR